METWDYSNISSGSSVQDFTSQYGSGTPTDSAGGNNPFARWWYGTDPDKERRDLQAWRREEGSAQAERDFQTWFDGTKMQRRVEDFVKAGFSPLAALENSASGIPTGQAASSQASGSSTRSNDSQALINLAGSVAKALAMIVAAAI